MGWHGDMESDLNEAAKMIMECGVNTLGWYEGVMLWNDTILEINDDCLPDFEEDIVSLQVSMGIRPSDSDQEVSGVERYLISTAGFDRRQLLKREGESEQSKKKEESEHNGGNDESATI